MFAICCRPSVCLSSVTLVHCILLSRLKFSAMFLRHLVPWPSINNRGKVYGDRSRGTPPSKGLNTRGVAKSSDFEHIEGYTGIYRKRCKIGGKLVLITNRKLYISFRLVQKSMTLNDLERHNGSYFALFHPIR